MTNFPVSVENKRKLSPLKELNLKLLFVFDLRASNFEFRIWVRMVK